MKISFLLILLFIFCIQIQAQKPKLLFESYSTLNGLSNNNANVFLQDYKGFLWIGTEYGLNRYDGYEFVQYYCNPKDSTSLSGDKIASLFEDSRGELLVGTIRGFDIYDRKNNRFIQKLQKKDKELWIRSFLEINGGVLMVGNTSVILFYDFASNKVYESPISKLIENLVPEGGLAFNKIILSNNKIYIADNNHCRLYQVDMNMTKVNIIELDDQLVKKTGRLEVKNIVELNKNKIVASTYGNGLFLIDNKSNESSPFTSLNGIPFELSSQQILQSFVYGSSLWVTTESGLNLIDLSQSKAFQYHNDEFNLQSLLSDKTHDFYIDNQKNIWISHFQKGVNICKFYNNKKFEFINHEINNPNSLNNDVVNAIKEDQDGNLWIATDGGGLNFYNKKDKTFKFYKNNPRDPKSIGSNAILALCIDSEGTLWVGSYLGGLAKYNKKTDNFTNYLNDPKNPYSINNNDVRSISEDHKHHLWLTTNGGGANLFDPKSERFIHFRHNDKDPKSLSLDWARPTLVDKDGDVWIGSFNGLSLFDKKDSSFINYGTRNECTNCLSTTGILALAESKNGEILIGTDKGLTIYNKKTKQFVSYDDKDGLIKEQFGIIEDKNGIIWLSSAAGIAKLDPKTKKIRYYNKEVDLQGQEYLMGSFFKSNTGKFYFGGIKGITSFYPDSIFDDKTVPKVVLTNLKIFNNNIEVGQEVNGQVVLHKDISMTDTIEFNYKNFIFSIEFAGIYFASPKKVQYMYKMLGLEANWNKTNSDRRFLTYTNLAPGTYQLLVKAANSDGVWNEKVTKITIIITPPFWKTWWFILLVLFLIVSAALSYYFYRIGLVKKRNAELEFLVDKRTIELKSANVELQEQKEEIQQQNEEILSTNDLLAIQHENLASSYKNMTLLSRFGQQLGTSLDMNVINKMIHNYIQDLIEVDKIEIGIYMSDGNLISWKYVSQAGNQLPSYVTHLSTQKNIATYCFTQKKEVLLPSENYDLFDYLGTSSELINNGKTIFCLPLHTEYKSIGVLMIENPVNYNLNANQIATVRSIAQYVTFALDNADAYSIINHRNESINGSIRYAKNIQQAILPTISKLEKYFEAFILYKPKDVVSGDFYWFSEPVNSKYIYLAVVDCTGHGVPGAFMSMIGNRLLNEIVIERHLMEPSLILDALNLGIISALRQNENDNDDGMEISLCRFEKLSVGYKLCFSSSKMAAYKYYNQEKKIEILKGDRVHIGGKFSLTAIDKFTQAEFDLLPGDAIYLSSDGIIDQNNEHRKRFGTARLTSFIETNQEQTMNEQKSSLEINLDEFMRNTKQRDDISVIGIKIRN